MPDQVLLKISDRVAHLTLNRPHKLNALDSVTIDALSALLDRIEADGNIRSVVLTAQAIVRFAPALI